MKTLSKYLRNEKFKFWLTIILVVIFSLHLALRVYQYKDNYLTKFDPKYWEYRYNTSQWVVPNSKNSIGDDGLYAYAGYKYVFEGMNPILNSAEVPPLGKYLTGITILVFQNQNLLGVLSGAVVLLAFYIFNLNIFKKKVLAFTPVFIFSFDMLFWEQLQANYFDLLYLTFLLLAFHFTIKKKYFLASIAIGCFAATKFPPTSILVGLSILIYVFVKSRKDLARLLLSFIAWPAVFVLSYLRFFILGNDFIEFLKVLKYFINYYTIGVKSQNHLMVFELLLTGRWQTWWNGVVKIPEWNLLWPTSMLISIASIRVSKKIFQSPILLLIIWIVVYFCFLIIVPVAPRYLLLLIPFLYNVAVWVLFENTGLKLFRRHQ